MSLYLEILDGKLKGTRTPARDGLTIGRKKGLLTIEDPKLSSKHAKVEARSDGSLWLIDQGSSNGIKIGEDGSKVKELKLESGVTFTLGLTPFQVISTEDRLSDDAPTNAVSATVTRNHWDILRELAERAAEKAPAKPKEVAAFSPPLRLKFIRGIQAGAEWTIGYGPRAVGSTVIDLKLEDASLPGVCFRLEPMMGKVLFQNKSDKDVKLNGSWVKSDQLKAGDIIEIRSTQIQVAFDEN